MMYVFTSRGVIAIAGGKEAAAAMQGALRQIADNVATQIGRIDDANALLGIARDALLNAGLNPTKAIGAAAISAATAAAILGVGVPVAGAIALSVGVSWAAGKIYESLFDDAIGIGQRAGEAAFDIWGGAISPVIGNTPDPLVKTIRYVDPLILDLNGDGLKITRLNGADSVLFDTDADSIRTATAWASADYGFLVLDRNANGSIDSGRELFGDETLLTNGDKAAHGFAALSELDSNTDGLFSALDAQFNAVRVWRDLNQDGISQTGELKTLADSNVQSVTLASTAVNQNYGDALLVQNGSFTRGDGSTGQAGSFILAQNHFVRAFAPVTVSDAAKALPNIGGTGWVRDLQEAATLSPDLIGAANAAANATTRAGYKSAVEQLIREWGNDSGFSSASNDALWSQRA